MSNIEQNEEFNQNNAQIPDFDESEFSTVFGDPAEHRKSNRKSNKYKGLKSIIAGVLAVGVLVGAFFAVVKLIPEKEIDKSYGIQGIEVLEYTGKDIKTVNIKNSNGEFKFYSEKQEAVDANTSSTTEKTIWYMEGYDSELIDSELIAEKINMAFYISASRVVENRTAEECGLANPIITATLVDKNDKQLTVSIGNKSLDNTGYYLKLSDSEKIYIVSETKELLDFKAIDFADSSALSGIKVTDEMADYKNSDGMLASFDSIILTNKGFSEPLVFVMNPDEASSEYMPYSLYSPIKRGAEYVDTLFTALVGGITADGAYSFDVSNDSLKKFGLDNPDATLKIKVGAESLTCKFKLQDDGFYAAVNENAKMIKKISPDNLKFITRRQTEFYSPWVWLCALDSLEALTVKTEKGEYAFGIEISENQDKDGEPSEEIKVTQNGKKIETTKFQNFYEQCISLSCADYTVDNLSASPALTLKYKDKKTGSVTVVEFRKATETKYSYFLNGKVQGRVSATAVNKVIEAADDIGG